MSFFVTGAVLDLVTLEVSEVAVRLAFQQGGPFAVARPTEGLACRFVDGEHVLAVNDDAGHAEGGAAAGDVGAADRVVGRGGLGVTVVLADEHHRQFPDGRQVQGFGGGALVGTSVTEEAGGGLARTPDTAREPGAAGQWRTATDDAVGTEHAAIDIGDVHRAALALAATGRFAADLGHHPVDLHALGNAVSVAAVGAGDEVVVVQVGAHPDGDRFFSGVEMNEAGDQAGGEILVQPVLEFADLSHPSIDPQQLVAIEVHGGGSREAFEVENSGLFVRPLGRTLKRDGV